MCAKRGRANGLDSSVFSRGEIPFKRIKLDDKGENHHEIALKYFALAHKNNYVSGVPACLLTLRIKPESLVTALRNGSAKIYRTRDTLAFTKPLCVANYPDIFDQSMNPIEPDLGKHWLAYGYQLLEQGKRKRCLPASESAEAADAP